MIRKGQSWTPKWLMRLDSPATLTFWPRMGTAAMRCPSPKWISFDESEEPREWDAVSVLSENADEGKGNDDDCGEMP
jgi:hypothetical protein